MRRRIRSAARALAPPPQRSVVYRQRWGGRNILGGGGVFFFFRERPSNSHLPGKHPGGFTASWSHSEDLTGRDTVSRKTGSPDGSLTSSTARARGGVKEHRNGADLHGCVRDNQVARKPLRSARIREVVDARRISRPATSRRPARRPGVRRAPRNTSLDERDDLLPLFCSAVVDAVSRYPWRNDGLETSQRATPGAARNACWGRGHVTSRFGSTFAISSERLSASCARPILSIFAGTPAAHSSGRSCAF